MEGARLAGGTGRGAGDLLITLCHKVYDPPPARAFKVQGHFAFACWTMRSSRLIYSPTAVRPAGVNAQVVNGRFF